MVKKSQKKAQWLRFVWIGLLVLILGVAVWVGLYAYSASQLEVSNIRLVEVQGVNTTGFDASFEVELQNNGLVAVGVENITYVVILDYSGEQLASGLITGGEWISPGESASFSLTATVDWEPTADLAVRLLSSEGTNATLEGTIFVTKLLFVDVKIPFSYTFDLESYVKQFVADKLEEYSDTLIAAGSALISGAKTFFGFS